MTTLASIAERQLRREKSDKEIIDAINLADVLQIDCFVGQTATDVLDLAKKNLARKTNRARKAVFRMLVDGRARNGHNDPQRAVLFNEIVAMISNEYSDWEKIYVGTLANKAREIFDLAIEGQPINRLWVDLDRQPTCGLCTVSKVNTEFLDFEDFAVKPICYTCAQAQLKELQGTPQVRELP